MRTLVSVAAASAPAPTSSAAPPRPAALVRSTSALAGLRAGALALSIATGFVLAWALGPEQLGRYEKAMAWAAFLGLAAGAGTEKLIVRELGAARGTGDLARAHGHVAIAFRVVGVATIVLALGITLAAVTLGPIVPPGVWLVAVGVAPLAALLRVRQATLQGLGHVVRGQAPELVVVPAAFLVALATVALAAGSADADTALGLQAVALAVGIAVAFGAGSRRATTEVTRTPARADFAVWRRAALPLAGIAALQVLNARADVVLLGALGADGSVGRYATCVRVAGLVAMVLLAANTALAPRIARMHAAGEHAALQRLLTTTARTTALIATAIGAGIVAFAEPLLGLFGPGFVAGRNALLVLVAAQIVNVAMGSVGLVLLMTGHERAVVRGLAVSATCGVALDALLIPTYGELGAAIASATALVVWNTLLARGVHRHLDLRTSALGPRPSGARA